MSIKTFFWSLSIFSYNNSFCQIDTLTKYAYLLYSPHENGFYKGSCFFAELNNKTFIITAKHVVGNWNPIEMKKEESSDLYFVRLKLKGINSYSPICINISKAKKDTSKPHYYENPDVYIQELENPSAYEINYINNFIPKIYLDTIQQPLNVFNCGYGGNEDVSLDILMSKKTDFSFGILLQNINNRNVFPHPNGFDKINYLVDSIQATTINLGGFSGGPVFFIYKDKPIIFGGIFIGMAANSEIIVRPEFVYKELIRISKSKRIIIK